MPDPTVDGAATPAVTFPIDHLTRALGAGITALDVGYGTDFLGTNWEFDGPDDSTPGRLVYRGFEHDGAQVTLTLAIESLVDEQGRSLIAPAETSTEEAGA